MKRGIFVLISILFASFVFVGCSDTKKKVSLEAPNNLLVENQFITFDTVKNATSYLINYDGMTFNVYPNSEGEIVFDGSKIFIEAKDYEIKVKAIGEGKYLDSPYSSVFVYSRQNALSTPTIYLNNNTLTWSNVEDATIYTIKVTLPDYSNYYYSARINNSNITPILNQVGEYKFQVKAGEKFGENEYSPAVSYVYIKQLDSPTNLSLQYLDDEIYLTFLADENSYGYKLYINGKEFNLYDLNLRSYSVDTGYKNYIKVKLSSFLKAQSVTVEEDFLSVAIKSVAAQSSNYLDSNKSGVIDFNVKEQLETPVLSLKDENSKVKLNWTKVDGAVGYTIYENYDFYLEVDRDWDSIFIEKETANGKIYTIQAVGTNDKVVSLMSNPVCYNIFEETEVNNIAFSGGIISWSEIPSARYILEISNGKVYKKLSLDNTNYSISELGYDDYVVRLTTIVEGCKPNVVTKEISYKKTLSKISNAKVSSTGYGFSLTFNEVSDAVGYAIRLNGEAVGKLFTTNVIDITSYMLASNLNEYKVEVMAVAGENKNLTSGAWTTVTDIAWTVQLDSPNFVVKNEYGQDVSSTPNKNDYSKYIVYVDPIENASSYTISVNYITIYDNVNYSSSGYDISSYLTSAQKYTIRVRANAGASNNYLNSEYTEKYVAKYMQLDSLNEDDMKVEFKDDKYWLSFTPQTLAASYNIRINNGTTDTEFLTSSTTIDITKYLLESGVYKIYITAEAMNGDNYFYISSSESTNPYVLSKELASLGYITNIDVEKRVTGHTQLLASWDKVDNAELYYINIYYTPSYKDRETKLIGELTSTTNSFNFAGFLTLEGKYEIKVKAMAENFESTTFASYSYDYLMTVDSDYKRNIIFIDGYSYSHYITSYDQFEKLLWYYYLYNDFNYYDSATSSFYKMKVMLTPTLLNSTDGKLILSNNSVFVGEFINKYELSVEFMENEFSSDIDRIYYMAYTALNSYYDKVYLTSNGKGVDGNLEDTELLLAKIKNVINLRQVSISEQNYFIFDYVASFYGDKLDVISDSQNYQKFGAYTKTLHSSEMRAQNHLNYVYAIDKLEKVDVTTSEQLFMAVQTGKSPNFVGDCEVARTVYENAKKVINSIIKLNMTDYEKVTAIYDWLINNVEYNYVFEDRARLVSDYTQSIYVGGPSVASYKYNYLEGIFYNENSRSAVAEGYAKAFVLLCRIEGIEAVKINGEITINETAYSYAWNKVYIDITPNDEETSKDWTVVDISASYRKSIFDTTYYQLPTHEYFMVSDSLHKSALSVEYISSKNNINYENYSAIDGNYYENKSYLYSISLYKFINSQISKVTYQGSGKLNHSSSDSISPEEFTKDVLKYLVVQFNKTNNCVIDIEVNDVGACATLVQNFNTYVSEIIKDFGENEWGFSYTVETYDNKIVIAIKPNT